MLSKVKICNNKYTNNILALIIIWPTFIGPQKINCMTKNKDIKRNFKILYRRYDVQ